METCILGSVQSQHVSRIGAYFAAETTGVLKKLEYALFRRRYWAIRFRLSFQELSRVLSE